MSLATVLVVQFSNKVPAQLNVEAAEIIVSQREAVQPPFKGLALVPAATAPAEITVSPTNECVLVAARVTPPRRQSEGATTVYVPCVLLD